MNRKELENDQEFQEFLRKKYRYEDDQLWMFDSSNSSPYKGTWRPVSKINNGNGYLNINITWKKKGYHFFQHRLIFFLNHGYFAEVIDHIDRDRSNNIISNLRAVSQSENCLNRKSGQNARGKIKYIGVSWRKDKNKYESRIIVSGKTIYLGRYKDQVQAAKARDKYIIENRLQDRYNLNFFGNNQV